MNDLVKRAQQGDQQAREQIIADFKPLVRATANKLFLISVDVEDLLMEGALGVVKAIDSFDQSKGNFAGFVKNCVVNHMFSVARHETTLKNKAMQDYVSLDEVVLYDESNPLKTTLYNQFQNKLNACVESLLTPTEKQVFNLFLEGYTYNEICQKTDKTGKAVDGALQRARKKLSVALNEYR
ncbi:MAG: sigma-70 family RNA polymerase sigma factor [Clostridia bacterium]|nr:sigma-70 family RNA polymerase sigma factor [Clostridia bacterium]